jgi:hypothetical protein
MKWVTRERPVIDRIACPWLIARFIDKQAEFVFVPPERVLSVAKETGATPYDVPGVEFSHVGDGCSFDAFVSKYGLDRDSVTTITRQSYARRRYRPSPLTPQSAGLLAISMGLRRDARRSRGAEHQFVLYDALLRLSLAHESGDAQLAARNGVRPCMAMGG